MAFGGWSIDLHPPGGLYASEAGSRHWHPDGNYHIPLRCFYSANVTNMWMAGRSISASHVAFGSTRVMATCAIGGEAVGTAAALAHELSVTPRQLVADHLDRVQHALVRTDASVLGVADTDPDDQALDATASASSTLQQIDAEISTGSEPLAEAIGLVVPAWPKIGTLEFLVDAEADTTLDVELHRVGQPQNYLPAQRERSVHVPVPAGDKQWTRVALNWTPAQPQNAFVLLRANPAVSVHRSDQPAPGLLCFRHRDPAPDERYTEQWRAWKQIWQRGGVCLRSADRTDAYRPELVIGGYARPYGGPQMWVSELLDIDPQPWLELAWSQPRRLGEVVLIFDDELDEDLINLHHHTTPFDVLPGLVRDYRVEALLDGSWTTLAEVTGNRRRLCRHRLSQLIDTARLRVTVTATNGAPRAHVVAVRVYH